MRCTGGEGFPTTLPCPEFEEEEGDNIKVGEEDEEEATQSNTTSDHIEEDDVEGSATAGQFEQGFDVTQEV